MQKAGKQGKSQSFQEIEFLGEAGKKSASNLKTGWFAINCKSDPVFLRMHDDSHAVMEISKNSLEVNLTERLAR